MLFYWVTWINLTQDRNEEGTPSKTVMNLSSLDVSTIDDQITTLPRNVGHITQ
jgi:hypothetical protein